MSTPGMAAAVLTFAALVSARHALTSRRPPLRLGSGDASGSGDVSAPGRWVDIPRRWWARRWWARRWWARRWWGRVEAVGESLRRRRRPAAADLPALLEAVAARLRAGGSLGQALVEAAPPPGVLADQWRRTAELVPALGAVGALQDWADRAEQRSVRLAAAALTLAARTGGSPARAVDGVAATLRCRLAVQAEIRALSSQARASAVVIALAPAGFGVLAGLGDPRTLAFLRTPLGLVVVSVGLGLDGLGAWWMARLCRAPAE